MSETAAPSLGVLYLLPTPVSAHGLDCALPAQTAAIARDLDHFIAENPKTARAFLKALAHPKPLQTLKIETLNEHTSTREAVADLLQPLLKGHAVGLVSDAGCPGVADPGAALVQAAHAAGVRVKPLVGPSSLLLALMASGLNGQRFRFYGYLPAESGERVAAIQSLERHSREQKETGLFIETPYRNDVMLKALCAHLSSATQLCVATDLLGPSEQIQTRPIRLWRLLEATIGKRPTVFLVNANGRAMDSTGRL